jgi:hypothetical protein
MAAFAALGTHPVFSPVDVDLNAANTLCNVKPSALHHRHHHHHGILPVLVIACC